MKFGFYSRIAVDNLRKNPRLYLPRILAEAGLLGCFCILITLAMDDKLSHTLGGGYLSSFMFFGAVVLGILSFVLILYINSFLMQKRKNEYGLYNVLGMGKRHILRVLFCESAYTAMTAAVLGLGFGVLFYKLSALFICKLLHSETVTGFYYINPTTALLPVLIFLGFDVFAYFVNCISVARLKPVELLAGKNTGEREPRIKWLLLILGVLTLGAGYYIAVTVKNPLQAIFLFFVAVVLVIIGTYCLFITGTTFVLKCLKKNKAYYYNKRHMPAVSGLLFRMKRNAVGLASIAILATGVSVMISTTVSLYGGVQDSADKNFPCQLYLSACREYEGGSEQIPSSELCELIRQVAEEKKVEIREVSTERYLEVYYKLSGNTFSTDAGNQKVSPDEITGVLFITEETYEHLSHSKISAADKERMALSDEEVGFCRISSSVNMAAYNPKEITVGEKTYAVKEQFAYFPVSVTMNGAVNFFGVVVRDEKVLEEIYLAQKEAYGLNASEYTDRVGVKFADEDAVFAIGREFNRGISDKLTGTYAGSVGYRLDTKWESVENMLDMYGSFLFLGILLGFVCLFATILIIYYKQISEGYEDRERFQIMEKVGMEKTEVKKAVGNQLVLQFFLPLLTAGIHTAMAFPMLLKLLKILMLTNVTLFVVCTLITYAVFALVYAAVYLLTAKTYYRIVS